MSGPRLRCWWRAGWGGSTLRQANACGAIRVTRPGCSDTMPYLAEVEAFLERHP